MILSSSVISDDELLEELASDVLLSDVLSLLDELALDDAAALDDASALDEASELLDELPHAASDNAIITAKLPAISFLFFIIILLLCCTISYYIAKVSSFASS